MSAPLDFYFDFTSTYGYLAAQRIDALAARYGRSVTWRPVLLGVIFKTIGVTPIVDVPLKGDYARRDMLRSARLAGIPFRFPERFPIPTQAAARAFYWLDAREPAAARTLAHALFRALFVEGRDISNPEAVTDIAATLGHDPATVASALADPAIKDRLKQANDEALARGVFGSPTVFVDGEQFWGFDRFDQIERWLSTGPF